MRTKSWVIASILAAVLVLSHPHRIVAADQNIKMSIQLEKGANLGFSAPLVYVNGKLAGIVPGTIAIPVQEAGVVIEIGLPHLYQAPLYSFVLGLDELKRESVNVVLTALSFKEKKEKIKWKDVFLDPNTQSDYKLINKGNDNYEILLPYDPYLVTTRLWRGLGFTSHRKWINEIPDKNNNSTKKGIYHLVYDPKKDGAVKLIKTSGSPEGFWSADTQLALGEGGTKEHWIIISIPSSATVETDVGKVGTTKIDKYLRVYKKTSYITIQREGYIDCIYRHNTEDFFNCSKDKCIKTILNGAKQLFCELAKK